MTTDVLKETLLLANLPGIGHGRIRALLTKFGDAGRVLAASRRDLTATDGIDTKTADVIRNRSLRDDEFARDQLRWMSQYQTKLVLFTEPEFPPLLRQLPDSPAFLFVRGQVEALQKPTIGVVGTRGPTTYGKTMADSLARELARAGVTVVSGLARGIDTQAHLAALQSGGTTVAVMGCGVDRIYPPENLKLALDMLDQGALVSEYPMQTPPDAVHFPGRNRIISGMSLGVVIVEAGEKSGAMITADFAVDQNREVFAVPGPAYAPKSRGPNRLIKQGAKLTESVEDILAEIQQYLEPAPRAAAQMSLSLTPAESTLLGALEREPLHIDTISKKSNLAIAEALNTLLNLELQGIVRQTAGKHFCRV